MAGALRGLPFVRSPFRMSAEVSVLWFARKGDLALRKGDLVRRKGDLAPRKGDLVQRKGDLGGVGCRCCSLRKGDLRFALRNGDLRYMNSDESETCAITTKRRPARNEKETCASSFADRDSSHCRASAPPQMRALPPGAHLGLSCEKGPHGS